MYEVVLHMHVGRAAAFCLQRYHVPRCSAQSTITFILLSLHGMHTYKKCQQITKESISMSPRELKLKLKMHSMISKTRLNYSRAKLEQSQSRPGAESCRTYARWQSMICFINNYICVFFVIPTVLVFSRLLMVTLPWILHGFLSGNLGPTTFSLVPMSNLIPKISKKKCVHSWDAYLKRWVLKRETILIFSIGPFTMRVSVTLVHLSRWTGQISWIQSDDNMHASETIEIRSSLGTRIYIPRASHHYF
jgi:hypothetical protein